MDVDDIGFGGGTIDDKASEDGAFEAVEVAVNSIAVKRCHIIVTEGNQEENFGS